MIDYAKILTELEEERATCQYVYGGMIPAFYTQALHGPLKPSRNARTARRRPGAWPRRYPGMTWRDEIDMEIRRQAIRLYPDCAALFELPLRVYAQIMQDNSMRRKPYRVSEVKIRKIIATMPEFQ